MKRLSFAFRAKLIARKGNPGAHVELGQKTTLAYDDVKLISVDGKLVDAR